MAKQQGAGAILPPRTGATMADAIALSSPCGRMSKRARAAAQDRLRVELFGKEGLQRTRPPQPTERERLLRDAAQARELAARGFRPRKMTAQAEELERRAAALAEEETWNRVL